MSLIRRLVGVLLAVQLIAPVHAQQLIPGYPDDVKALDPREVALLPPFCKYTQLFRDQVPGGSDAVAAQRWSMAAGPTFIHLHHYCYGLMNANRGLFLAKTDVARRRYLNDAVLEFDYVIARAPADHVLVPELLARKGQALLKLGQPIDGLNSIERAIKIKPDYWPAYAYASEYFEEGGDLNRSRQWLENGLAAIPDSVDLKFRLQRAGKTSSRRSDRP